LLRCSSRYFQAEAFLFCSVLSLVLAFVLEGVHSSLSLGLLCPLQNFLVLPSVSCLQDLVFLGGIFVLAGCKSGFSCRDSYCCFSLICWPVLWFSPILHLRFSPFLLMVINPARQGSNFLCPDPARVFHRWCLVSTPNSVGPIFFAIFSDRGSSLKSRLSLSFLLIL
jgi:hypothetical protein